jgi:hypothetical protein
VPGRGQNLRKREPELMLLNPLTTSAFDLPDRLAAKAGPALIGGDEEHFAAIAESLRQTIADLSDRLDAEARRPAASARRRWTGTWRSTG